jgi:hypothetical protein
MNSLPPTHQEHAKGLSPDELAHLICGFCDILIGKPLYMQRFTASIIAIYAFELARHQQANTPSTALERHLAALHLPPTASEEEIERARERLFPSPGKPILGLAKARRPDRKEFSVRLKKGTPKRRGKTRFPGIGRDAKALGVNRSTLFRVLSGEWGQLKSLRARYEQLKGVRP